MSQDKSREDFEAWFRENFPTISAGCAARKAVDVRLKDIARLAWRDSRSAAADVEAMRRDAGRYRWLRERQIPLEGHDFLSTQDILDRRIDAAMAKGSP